MIQLVYWVMGIFVAIMTIGGATARVVRELANLEKAIALLQRDMEHMTDLLSRVEKKLETATGSQ